MKALSLLVMVLSLQAQASFMNNDGGQAFKFKFSQFQGEVYEYEIKANSKDDAYQKAAQACFDHFKAGRHVSMDFGQDIIDVCVNPRSNY